MEYSLHQIIWLVIENPWTAVDVPNNNCVLNFVRDCKSLVVQAPWHIANLSFIKTFVLRFKLYGFLVLSARCVPRGTNFILLRATLFGCPSRIQILRTGRSRLLDEFFFKKHEIEFLMEPKLINILINIKAIVLMVVETSYDFFCQEVHDQNIRELAPDCQKCTISVKLSH